MWAGCDKAWGYIEGALPSAKFLSILCFVLEMFAVAGGSQENHWAGRQGHC